MIDLNVSTLHCYPLLYSLYQCVYDTNDTIYNEEKQSKITTFKIFFTVFKFKLLNNANARSNLIKQFFVYYIVYYLRLRLIKFITIIKDYKLKKFQPKMSLKDKMMCQVAEPITSSGNKVTVVGVGQVGMACAFSILTQVFIFYIFFL